MHDTLDIVRSCAEKGGLSGKPDDLEKDRERMRDCLAKVKDYHDTGRTGWWLLIGVIPLLGAIAIIVFFAQDGEPGTNRFGSNPKEGSTGHTVAAAAAGKSWAASTGKR